MNSGAILRVCIGFLAVASITAAGGQWSPVFSTSGQVNDLHVYDGKLHVASLFEGSPGEAYHISGVYDGSTLVLPANDFSSGSIYAFTTHNGQLFAGGDFEREGGPIGVGVWDGSNWSGSQYNIGPVPVVVSLCSYDGSLFVGFDTSGDLPSCVWMHDGAEYSTVGGLPGRAHDLATFNGQLFAGGIFTEALGTFVRWTNGAWETAGPRLGGGAVGVLESHNGTLYVGGTFTNIIGPPFPANLLYSLAKWNGTNLSGVTAGASCGHVMELCSTSAGLYVATDLTLAGGSSSQGIALWDGSAWQRSWSLDPDDVVTAIEEYDGHIYIGVSNNGTHQVYRNDGQVGIDDPDTRALRIGPNPAADHVQVLSDRESWSSYLIRDHFGRVVRKGEVHDFIWVADLPPAIYTLELTTGIELHRSLFIKQ